MQHDHRAGTGAPGFTAIVKILNAARGQCESLGFVPMRRKGGVHQFGMKALEGLASGIGHRFIHGHLLTRMSVSPFLDANRPQ
jgi:hypothetical protein